MPFVSRRELARLERELSSARSRAISAEERLEKERVRCDYLVLQLASRVVTKNGGYGLETEATPFVPPSDDPTMLELAHLEFFKEKAAAAGFPEEDAVQRWEKWRRGESPMYESEGEN